MSSRHVKSSFILVNFITCDDNVDCYPDQVQYFFKHIVDFEDGPVEHNLAYVRWYNRQKHLRFDIILVLMMMRKLVMSNYGKMNFILMVATVLFILCRFVPVKCKISNRQDAIEYLAINPINRKFHIR